MGKLILQILVGAAVFALGVLLTRQYYQKAEETQRIESTVLLEKVQNVCKLVTVEGTFNELYDETNIKQLTFYLPIPTKWDFEKKAIIQVTGKVLVGYDMKAIKITADSASRTIYLSNFPKPEILSIDHQVQYKNLEESYFNSFSATDFTQLNKNAKEVLHKKALESKLLEQADEQGNQLLEAIRFMIESSGWNVQYEGMPTISTQIEEFVN